MRIPVPSRLLAAFALSATFACAQGADGNDPSDQPTSLRDVEIPEDFTFATSRGVALTVEADDAVLADGQGALEVARADGRVLYRGPMVSGQPLTLNLSVPTKDDAVSLRLSAGGAEHEAQVQLTGDAASFAFGQ